VTVISNGAIPCGLSPAAICGLEELETEPLAMRWRERRGTSVFDGAVELAWPSRRRPMVREAFGPRVAPVGRVGWKPHGCLSGETNRRGPGRRKPSRGSETLKAERRWARQARGRRKPRRFVARRPSQKGLPVLMAPKGQKPQERCCPGNGQRAEVAV
jgi:hypothetical protein